MVCNYWNAMCLKSHATLYDSLDPEQCWTKIRAKMVASLFGPKRAICVPTLDTAQHFDLLHVFIKRKRLFRKPEFSSVGSLSDLLYHTEWSMYCEYPPPLTPSADVFGKNRLQTQYLYQFEDLNTSVEVKIGGAFHRSIKANYFRRDLRLDPHLPVLNGVRSIYVITEVIYAKSLYFKVTSSGSNRILSDASIDSQTPLAFVYRKYRLRENGLLGEQLYTRLRYKEGEADWSVHFETNNESMYRVLRTSMKKVAFF